MALTSIYFWESNDKKRLLCRMLSQAKAIQLVNIQVRLTPASQTSE